jgi:uncharacterized protein (UPF0335 family)
MPVSNNELSGLIQRIQRLESERQGLADDIKEIYAEAKQKNFNVKIIRKVIARQKLTEHELREEARMIAEYEAAIGDLADTPLGVASRPQAMA